MRKISAMYEWSGGTDYRHTCRECRNCILEVQGKRKVHKCMSYGIDGSYATEWNAANIACRAFDKEPPTTPLIQQKTERIKKDEVEGQMSIFDFL